MIFALSVSHDICYARLLTLVYTYLLEHLQLALRPTFTDWHRGEVQTIQPARPRVLASAFALLALQMCSVALPTMILGDALGGVAVFAGGRSNSGTHDLVHVGGYIVIVRMHM
jgi:hypothetical protein